MNAHEIELLWMEYCWDFPDPYDNEPIRSFIFGGRAHLNCYETLVDELYIPGMKDKGWKFWPSDT